MRDPRVGDKVILRPNLGKAKGTVIYLHGDGQWVTVQWPNGRHKLPSSSVIVVDDETT